MHHKQPTLATSEKCSGMLLPRRGHAVTPVRPSRRLQSHPVPPAMARAMARSSASGRVQPFDPADVNVRSGVQAAWQHCRMMLPPSGVRVWPATGATDMHRGMNGLALQVQQALQGDPQAGDPYVFRGSDLELWPRAEDFGSATTRGAIWGVEARYELPTGRPRARISDEEVSKRKRCSGISVKISA